MLFFKRILDFRQSALAQLRDKRKGTRHTVGSGFPLKGTVNLTGAATPAKGLAPAPGSGCDWSGSLANLSTHGVSLLLPPAAVTARGERTTLRLSIEKYSLQVPCVVAYFRILSTHSVCGLTLEFADFMAEKAYVQLLEAVRIGADFAPLTSGASSRCPPGLRLEHYRADAKSRLAVWRKTADAAIDSFELVIGDHCLRGEAAGPTLEIYARQASAGPGQAARSDPAYHLSAGVTDEVRQLFRWVLPNLNRAVPADVRAFLLHVISETRTRTERADARKFPPPVSFPPPGRRGTRPPLPAK